MPTVNVTRTTNADPDALWSTVRDFGNVRWIPGGENAELRGEGPGMLRILEGPKGPIHERLESVDEANRTLVYTIPENVPFPVRDYRATMVVSDDGGRGRLSWSCEFVPEGVSEDEAAKVIETMYGVMVGWIEDAIART